MGGDAGSGAAPPARGRGGGAVAALSLLGGSRAGARLGEATVSREQMVERAEVRLHLAEEGRAGGH